MLRHQLLVIIIIIIIIITTVDTWTSLDPNFSISPPVGLRSGVLFQLTVVFDAILFNSILFNSIQVILCID